MFWIYLVLPLAWAQDAESTADPPVVEAEADARLEALEAELATLRAQIEQMQRDALLAEAEALASETPPPPPPPPSSKNVFNPALTAFGDAIGTVGIQDGAILPGSGPWLRSLELDLRSDVDPFAKAVAVIALEQEPPYAQDEGEPPAGEGHASFAVVPEEVYVDFVALPGGLSARVGQFRQPFGVTNKSHPHDLPWTDIPLPITEFLGEEGYTDVGGLASWRLPNTVTGITVQGGVLRGGLLDPDDEVAMPQWLGRVEWFHETGQFDWGLGASETGDDQDIVGGADLFVRWRKSSWRSAMLLAELLTDGERLGGYAGLQVQPTRPLFLGARADWLGESYRVGGYASYYTSEFLRIRAGATKDAEQLLMHLQLTFVWGSHPIEPYWVNR
jgi:hypothetical protein